MHVRAAVVAGMVAVAASAVAQQGAPRESLTATVGGKKVSIEYGRPALKNRDLAELMKQLPADKVWRAGSEQVTTLTTEGPVLVGDKKLAAGKYTVYVHVAESGERTLLLNKDEGMPLGQLWAEAPENLKNAPWPQMGPKGYGAVADKEAARVSMKKVVLETPVDLFTVKLSDKALNMSWGKESWTVDLKPVN